jgi:hypothetical protein
MRVRQLSRSDATRLQNCRRLIVVQPFSALL